MESVDLNPSASGQRADGESSIPSPHRQDSSLRPEPSAELSELLGALRVLTNQVGERVSERPRERPLLWWQKTGVIVALIGVFGTIITATYSYFRGEADLKLADVQHQHAVRMDYVRTTIDPAAPAGDRESRLKLLIALLGSKDDLRKWADRELQVIAKDTSGLRSQIEGLKDQHASAANALHETERQLETASVTNAQSDEVQRLRQELAEKSARERDLRAKTEVVARRLTSAPEQILGWTPSEHRSTYTCIVDAKDPMLGSSAELRDCCLRSPAKPRTTRDAPGHAHEMYKAFCEGVETNCACTWLEERSPEPAAE